MNSPATNDSSPPLSLLRVLSTIVVAVGGGFLVVGFWVSTFRDGINWNTYNECAGNLAVFLMTAVWLGGTLMLAFPVTAHLWRRVQS